MIEEALVGIGIMLIVFGIVALIISIFHYSHSFNFQWFLAAVFLIVLGIGLLVRNYDDMIDKQIVIINSNLNIEMTREDADGLSYTEFNFLYQSSRLIDFIELLEEN